MRGVFDIRKDRPAKRIQEALYKEAEKRSSTPWRDQVENEFNAVLDAVNLERSRNGIGPADPEDVKITQRMAQGHVDYVLKWPLYCEEIVNGKRFGKNRFSG